jgi:hypothetical protein
MICLPESENIYFHYFVIYNLFVEIWLLWCSGTRTLDSARRMVYNDDNKLQAKPMHTIPTRKTRNRPHFCKAKHTRAWCLSKCIAGSAMKATSSGGTLLD